MIFDDVLLAPKYLGEQVGVSANKLDIFFTGLGSLKLNSGLSFPPLPDLETDTETFYFRQEININDRISLGVNNYILGSGEYLEEITLNNSTGVVLSVKNNVVNINMDCDGGVNYFKSSAVPTDNNHLVNKTYADSLAIDSMKYKGVFSASNSYNVDDCVLYSGEQYILITEPSLDPGDPFPSPPDAIWEKLSYIPTDSVLTTQGDMLYYGSGSLKRLPAGTVGSQLLFSNTNIPYWDKSRLVEMLYGANDGCSGIAGGYNNSMRLALMKDGSLTFWGALYNGYFVAGSSSAGGWQEPQKFPLNSYFQIPKFRKIVGPITGISFFFISEDDDLYFFGRNQSGCFGEGNTAARRRLTPSSFFPSIGKKIKDVFCPPCVFTNKGMFAAPAHFLTTDNLLYACGYNCNGALGTGSSSTINTPALIMSDVKTVRKSCVSVGYDSVVAIQKLDGSIWVCGKNTSGTAGQGDTSIKYSPVMVPSSAGAGEYAVGGGPYGITGVRNFLAFSGGSQLKNLYLVGRNYYGLFGSSFSSSRYTTPQLVYTFSSPIKKIKTSESYFGTLYIILENNECWTSGFNTDGQAGHPTDASGFRKINTSVVFGYDIGIRDVFPVCSYYRGGAFFVTTDERLFFMGSSWYGSAGTGETGTTSFKATAFELKLPEGGVVKDIKRWQLYWDVSSTNNETNGSSSTAILLEDGRVYTSGSLDYCNLGNKLSFMTDSGITSYTLAFTQVEF